MVPGPKKSPKRSGGNAQLVEAGNRHIASGSGAKRGGIVQIVDRDGQRGNIRNVVGAGIVAVEQVEEFRKGRDGKTVVHGERAADAKVHLDVGSAAQFVQRSLHPIDYRAGADWSGQSDRSRAFRLEKRGELEARGNLERTGQNKSVANIFAGGTVIPGRKGILRIADAIDVIEQFAKDAAPGLRFGERVDGIEMCATRDIAL